MVSDIISQGFRQIIQNLLLIYTLKIVPEHLMEVIHTVDEFRGDVVLFQPSLDPLSLLVVHRLVHVKIGKVVGCLSEHKGQVYAS